MRTHRSLFQFLGRAQEAAARSTTGVVILKALAETAMATHLAFKRVGIMLQRAYDVCAHSPEWLFSYRAGQHRKKRIIQSWNQPNVVQLDTAMV